jgi:hypothetical protein
MSRPGCSPFSYTDVFSPGFALRGHLGGASLQVRPLRQRGFEYRLAGACAAEPRPKSLTTRSALASGVDHTLQLGTDCW